MKELTAMHSSYNGHMHLTKDSRGYVEGYTDGIVDFETELISSLDRNPISFEAQKYILTLIHKISEKQSEKLKQQILDTL